MLSPYALLWLAMGVSLIVIGLIDLIVQWIEDNTPSRTRFHVKWAAGGFMLALFLTITCEILGAIIPVETRWALAFVGLFVGLLMSDSRIECVEE